MPNTPHTIHFSWEDVHGTQSGLWQSERRISPPKKILRVNDTITADQAYRLACEGTFLLWEGDYQNARQLLQALARRIDKSATQSKGSKQKKHATLETSPSDAFHRHRLAQSQRARILGAILIPLNSQYQIQLKRAPNVEKACTETWGTPNTSEDTIITSLRELLGIISAHEWRKNGVEIKALGASPNNRIFPHYGVFSPIRGEYIELIASAPLPKKQGPKKFTAFDIGTGTGVIAAILAKRGFEKIIATDLDSRALACASENLTKLGLLNHTNPEIKLLQTDLFPEGKASLIICNPPWIPARPSSPLEHAVYDENSQMLKKFLKQLSNHLEPEGEGWLILSDLSEHLGLRSRDELLNWIKEGGLKIAAQLDIKPQHPKAKDPNNRLHFARSLETTSLWQLVKA